MSSKKILRKRLLGYTKFENEVSTSDTSESSSSSEEEEEDRGAINFKHDFNHYGYTQTVDDRPMMLLFDHIHRIHLPNVSPESVAERMMEELGILYRWMTWWNESPHLRDITTLVGDMPATDSYDSVAHFYYKTSRHLLPFIRKWMAYNGIKS